MTAGTNISVEDRLSEMIKKSEVGAFLGEEDLLELSKRVIQRAVFEPRKVARSYGGFDEGNPILVDLVLEAFKPEVTKYAQEWVEKLKTTEEFKELLSNAMAHALPTALLMVMREFITSSGELMSDYQIQQLKARMKQLDR
jgi:hypothetical protein